MTDVKRHATLENIVQESTTQPAQHLSAVRRVAVDVAGPAADAVDREARFPHEAIDALKRARMMSALVPAELGGFGTRHGRARRDVRGARSTLRRLGDGLRDAPDPGRVHRAAWDGAALFPALPRGARRAAERHRIGHVRGRRRRRDALEPLRRPDRRGIASRSSRTRRPSPTASRPTISSSRREEEPTRRTAIRSWSSSARQTTRSSRRGSWDTLGMRGTCSPPFKLTSQGGVDQILVQPFADIASHTMVPFSHILWASCWLGIATAAVTRARAFVRTQARAKPGTVPPTALRLAEASSMLQTMRANVHDVASECEALMSSRDRDRRSVVDRLRPEDEQPQGLVIAARRPDRESRAAHLRDHGLQERLQIRGRPASARRALCGAHGRQRPDLRDQRIDASRPQGRLGRRPCPRTLRLRRSTTIWSGTG